MKLGWYVIHTYSGHEDKVKASMDLDAIARTPVDVEKLTDPNYAPGPDEPNTVTEALAASGLVANRLELEISESWVMEGPFRAEKQMRLLNDMVIRENENG